LLAAVLAAALLTAGVLPVAGLGESAGREEGVTLRDVAADPAAYVGRTVTVSGEIAENAYLSTADASIALVIGDDAGQNLLVLPRAGAGVPRDLTEDTVLRVRGTVGHRPATLDDRGPLSPMSRVMALSDARAIVRADRVELLHPRRVVDRRRPPFPRAHVRDVLREPAAVERPVVVTGRATAVSATGFVLEEDGASIYVGAPAAALRAITEGEVVSVRADVARLSPFRAGWIAGRAGDAPAGAGDAFLRLRSIRP
jgi:hypothetical protein